MRFLWFFFLCILFFIIGIFSRSSFWLPFSFCQRNVQEGVGQLRTELGESYYESLRKFYSSRVRKIKEEEGVAKALVQDLLDGKTPLQNVVKKIRKVGLLPTKEDLELADSHLFLFRRLFLGGKLGKKPLGSGVFLDEIWQIVNWGSPRTNIRESLTSLDLLLSIFLVQELKGEEGLFSLLGVSIGSP